jgi:hypothetical protein
MPSRHRCLSLLLLLSACGSPSGGGRAACGLASLAGPTALLTQFSVPQQTLSVPPRNLPGRLVARFVAGGAFPAIVGRTDSTLVIGVEAPLAATARPGFGCWWWTRRSVPGCHAVRGRSGGGRPRLGDVSIGSTTIPLIGIQLDPAKIEDANCPFFPDSVLP